MENVSTFSSNAYYNSYAHSNAGHYLFWFVIIVLVVWILLRAFNPTWVQSKNDINGNYTGLFDAGKAFFASIIVAIIILFIICLICCACGGWGRGEWNRGWGRY